MKRILIPNEGPDPTPMSVALAMGLKECKLVNSTELALITPMKDNLDTIEVGKFLGEAVSKKLMKGEKIPITGHGVSLIHFSANTVQKGRTPKVGIVFYLSLSSILKLDDLPFETLIFVPWLLKEGEQWASKWDAVVHGDEGAAPRAVNLSANVVASLVALTSSVNLSTGLGHPSDMAHAKRRFAELRAAGERWEPKEVEKWAARNGWRASDAKELAKVSSRSSG